MVWKATPEKNSFAIFFSPFGRRGLIINRYALPLVLRKGLLDYYMKPQAIKLVNYSQVIN